MPLIQSPDKAMMGPSSACMDDLPAYLLTFLLYLLALHGIIRSPIVPESTLQPLHPAFERDSWFALQDEVVVASRLARTNLSGFWVGGGSLP